MAQENEYISEAAQAVFESSKDASIRTFMEGVEEARRLQRGLELRVERAEAAVRERDEALQEKKILFNRRPNHYRNRLKLYRNRQMKLPV